MNLRPSHRRAFTLVEVLLALFVFTFGLLGLLGVMAGLLGSVSKIEEKHQTADLSGLLQQALRDDPSAKTFSEVYTQLVSGPVGYLAYTVQSDLTDNSTRENKIVRASTGITETDIQNLNGPITKILVQPSASYKSLEALTADGKPLGTPAYTFKKKITWATSADNSPDPYITVDAFVYVLTRPTTLSEFTQAYPDANKHPEGVTPTRHFSITLPR